MRLRLLVAFGIVALVSIAAVAIFASADTAQQVRAYMFRGGLTGADEIVSTLEGYYNDHQSWVGVQSYLGQGGLQTKGKRMGMMGQRLILASADGKVIAGNVGNSIGDQLTSEQIKQAISLRNKSNQIIGYLYVEGGMYFQAGDETPLISRLNNAVSRAALVGGGVALLLALIFSNSLIRPIQQLTRAAQRLSSGDLGQRVTIKGGAELSVLAKSFNHMAESLQLSEQRKRSMTADIAHELRTPLAIQRAQIEAMQDGLVPISAENLQTVLDQTQILSRLVDDLRTLSLAEEGALQLDKGWVELAELAGRSADQFRTAAAQKNITIAKIASNLPEGADCRVWGDSARIGQILNNLLSNAVRYSNEGGQIEIGISETADLFRLTVHDSGPGIPEDDLPHIFERFYRVGSGRSREDGGSGLGLAIARQIAIAHGGDLVAENHPLGGALFTLILPKGREIAGKD